MILIRRIVFTLIALHFCVFIPFEHQWQTCSPSQSKYASFDPMNHELVRLTVEKGPNSKISALFENIVYEQDRDANAEARKILQHHLSSLALCDITGPELCWSQHTYAELKYFLKNVKVKR